VKFTMVFFSNEALERNIRVVILIEKQIVLQ